MASRLAVRRLALSGPTNSHRPALAVATTLTASSSPAFQRRSRWNFRNPFGGKSSNKEDKVALPLTASEDLDDPAVRAKYQNHMQAGDAQDTIFQDEIDEANADKSGEPGGGSAGQATAKTRDNTSLVLDPNPRARVRWQRKKVIQMVRKHGRLTKDERIRASERELLHKSHFMATSLKKLVMLSRQIIGKPVDNAIAQMRWSKKKMAQEVKYYLEEARDRAITERGMGLGKVKGEVFEKSKEIVTKDGKRIEVKDPTTMYVAQSWVGRGEWRAKSIDYKGRGRMGLIHHPSTSISILLKEEKTRVRQHEEREAKKAAKGPWVHLPDRKIYSQRPYYTW